MIEVGEYVRVDGQIGKIIDICDCEQCKERGYLEPIIDNHNIYITIYDKQHDFHGIKHSKDITDLIEKNDFINGCRVYEVEEKGITVYQKVEHSSIDYNWITADEIKTILTKEQYEANCYKVKEE